MDASKHTKASLAFALYLLCDAPAQAAGLPTAVTNTVSWSLLFLVTILVAYGIRHYILTYSRLFRPQSRLYEGINCAQWPSVTIFIPGHNEEKVIDKCIIALAECDYPMDKLQIIPVNDRSTDGTAAICDQLARRYPGLVEPFHRTEGKGGKPAALKDAASRGRGDIFVIFDADYIPGRGLLKQIVSPFFDPEIGVTMGRVVPYNVHTNLLTRMLDMERSAGYQVEQQSRMNNGLLPQYGGTVGGIRVSALHAVGGFKENILSEDTDLSFRLILAGWRVGYINSAECYEEVPENWPVRIRQLSRWAKGHNHAMLRYTGACLRSPWLTPIQKLEAVAVLGLYAVAPLTLIGWILVLAGYFAGSNAATPIILPLLALVAYGGFGNSAAFFEMGAAVNLDGSLRRIRMLPLNAVGYAVSAITITIGFFQLVRDLTLNREMKWDKTARFRQGSVSALEPQSERKAA